MSTEENKAIFRRIIEEVWNKGDLATVDELVAPNHIYHFPGREDIRGPEGLKEFVTMVRTAFPDIHITIYDEIAEGDKVACRCTWQGTHKGELRGIAPSGHQIAVESILIAHFAGGEGVETWESTDSLGMWQQMGLTPPPIGQGGG